jgi:hypothetical protein
MYVATPTTTASFVVSGAGPFKNNIRNPAPMAIPAAFDPPPVDDVGADIFFYYFLSISHINILSSSIKMLNIKKLLAQCVRAMDYWGVLLMTFS